MTTPDEITLAGMRFHTLVGVLPHEHELPQPLEVDLSVRLAGGMRGDVPTLDYRAVYDVARAAVDAGPIDYLERAAERMAAGALALTGVTSVRVAVRKPHVALGGPLRYAEVVVERRRSGGPDA